jgi:guanylate kinase
VTGPSGAGKGTMVEALLERVPQLRLAVSATTRARRPSEQHGVHYLFLAEEEFDQRLAADDFLEYHVFPWGQRSGTLRSELDRIVAEGGVPLLELELNGAAAVKRKEPRAVTIFVDAPLSELERRLCERATESEGEIEERIALARKQKERAGEFDYVVENDDRAHAADECVAIVERELARNATEQHALGVSGADGRTGQARTP